MCCESFDQGNGFIVFDFSEKPYKILYDGVFISDLILEQNILKDPGEYSYYPNNTVGVFENKNGIQGFWYYFQNPENEGQIEKSFLKKTGNLDAAKELIKKYNEEDNKFNEFWDVFKQAIIQKNYQEMSKYTILPLFDSSDYSTNRNYKSVMKTEKEVESRLRLIFEDCKRNGYNVDWNENKPYRFEDHYPGIPGGGVYLMQVYLVNFVFDIIGNKFKLVKILHTWG